MHVLTAIGLTTFSSGCLKVDDATGLEALRSPMIEHGREVQRIGDPALVTSFRKLAAVWEAASHEGFKSAMAD